MEFEFQESEVIFGVQDRRIRDEDDAGDEYSSFQDVLVPAHHPLRQRGTSDKKSNNKKIRRAAPSSPPLDIPNNLAQFGDSCDFLEEEEDDDDDDEMVPPHVIVGRRWVDGKLASSVCFSHGRTLKGRHLSEVRNSILRMTGFLES